MLAVIVQARLGSSRLPGKTLMDIAGRTALWHCLARCRAIPSADVVVCAVPDLAQDDPVAEEAERCGAVVFRGSETDVLARYHGAARAVGADLVMRVTSDCQFVDPELCEQVIALRAEAGVDYACNNLPPSWPHGLDCEVFTMAAFERAFAEAKDPYEREHVTPWLRTHPDIAKAVLHGPGGQPVGHRWTLDYPEDLEFFRAVCAHLPPPPHLAGREEILAVLAAHPDLARINAHRRDPARVPAEG